MSNFKFLKEKQAIIESLRNGKNTMFGECESLDDVITTYNLKGEQVAILGIAYNTILESVAKSLEKEL